MKDEKRKAPPIIIRGGVLNIKGWHNKAKEVYAIDGVAPCVHTQSNNLLTKIIVYEGDSIQGKESPLI